MEIMRKGSILVVDDERSQREILKTILEDEGYETYLASGGKEALKTFKEFRHDLILTDLKMPDMDGIELMDSIPEEPLQPAIIIMTAHRTISSAVEAIRKGAFDYLTKPLDKEELLIVLKRAMERMNLLKENYLLKQELISHFKLDNIIGNSLRMKEVFDLVKKVSSSHATILLCGESGTGKELIAKAIHYNSPRRTKPFTAINCAAIPENLLESELFGYEPGAFTGATSRKIGLFEAANGGTLLLDEIGDLQIPMQSKILRVLQEKEIRRVGGRENIRVDVRIVAATNKDLEREMKKGNFREDLYYRLKVITISLPALRDRIGDIPELTEYFISKFNKEFGKRIKDIREDALKVLMQYSWPGNVRQLESAIERAVLLGDGEWITVKDLPEEIKRPILSAGSIDIEIPEGGLNFEEVEKNLLIKAMEMANGVVARAAKLLGLSYKTFWYRWEKFGLDENYPEKRKEFLKRGSNL
ncbi:MAG: sigma-54-dependent Fis family transcriptional regulator [Nitrospirae bacterium]|nr:sigma-54-dependent Fis family transcriptional regulator [Nitrospirota bacterium]